PGLEQRSSGVMSQEQEIITTLYGQCAVYLFIHTYIIFIIKTNSYKKPLFTRMEKKNTIRINNKCHLSYSGRGWSKETSLRQVPRSSARFCSLEVSMAARWQMSLTWSKIGRAHV